MVVEVSTLSFPLELETLGDRKEIRSISNLCHLSPKDSL